MTSWGQEWILSSCTFAFFVPFLVGFSFPLLPYVIQKTIDGPIADKDSIELLQMLYLMIAIIVFRAVLQYYHSYLSGWLGQSVIKDIRIKLYKHILDLKLKLNLKFQPQNILIITPF